MDFKKHTLKNGQDLIIREATVNDAATLVKFVNGVSSESDFLTFGPGEFDIKEKEEREFLQSRLESENQIYILASINNTICAILNFNAGQRPRVRHSGDFNMVVQKHYWGWE